MVFLTFPILWFGRAHRVQEEKERKGKRKEGKRKKEGGNIDWKGRYKTVTI